MKPNIYWNNKAEVLEAVSKIGANLKYASEELRNDKDIILAELFAEPFYQLFYDVNQNDNSEEEKVSSNSSQKNHLFYLMI